MLKKLRKKVLRRILEPLVKEFYKTPHAHGDHPIEIGRNVSLANCILNSRSGTITIGDDCIFGHGSMLLTGYHDVYVFDRYRPTLTDAGRDIRIGRNVWIASGAIVVGPVEIGDNAVIGAGSVVTRDIPPACVAAGVPAEVVKKIEGR